jgi:hypothetical protein
MTAKVGPSQARRQHHWRGTLKVQPALLAYLNEHRHQGDTLRARVARDRLLAPTRNAPSLSRLKFMDLPDPEGRS